MINFFQFAGPVIAVILVQGFLTERRLTRIESRLQTLEIILGDRVKTLFQGGQNG